MELVIDIDQIKDPSKREWLIKSLKLMHIDYQTNERPQTIAEYNEDLRLGDEEIDQGKFTNVADLKEEVKKW